MKHVDTDVENSSLNDVEQIQMQNMKFRLGILQLQMFNLAYILHCLIFQSVLYFSLSCLSVGPGPLKDSLLPSSKSVLCKLSSPLIFQHSENILTGLLLVVHICGLEFIWIPGHINDCRWGSIPIDRPHC